MSTPRHLGVIVVLLCITSCLAECPPGCACDYTRSEAKCTGLKKLPISLPAAMTKFLCYRCDLWEITPDSLNGMTHLKQFILQEADLNNIAPFAFSKLSDVERIHLSFNKLKIIDGTSFQGCGNLRFLRLFGNAIEDIVQPFSGAHNLENLDLSDNMLRYVPKNAFVNLPRLAELRLDGNNIDGLQPYAFLGLTGLTYLSLYGNKIHRVDVGAFEDLASLKRLSLGGNRLADVDETVFAPLKSLEELSLRSNNIVLKSHMFRRLPTLTTLRLSDSGITNIPNQAFDGLSQLKELFMSKNSLGHLSVGMFDGLANLHTLLLMTCKISQIDADVFLPLQSLYKLHLAYNDLDMKDGSVFNLLRNLAYLYLNANNFSQVPDNINLPQLHTLAMGKNNLTTLPVDLNMAQSPKLDTILLNENHVTRFPPTPSLTSLKHVQLQDNDIKTLNERELRPTFEKLMSLNLFSNPIHCNCETSWLKKIKALFYSGGVRFRCATPHKKLLLFDTSDKDMACLAPTIDERNTFVRVNANSVELSCRASGDPIPDVHWDYLDDSSGRILRGSLSTVASRAEDYGNTVFNTNNMLLSLKERAGKKYKGFVCRAESIAGKSEKKFDI